MKINCDFPSDTGGDRKQIQWEATFLSEGCMRRRNGTKVDWLKKRKSAALQKNEHTMTKRVRKGEKRPKKKEREGEGEQTLGQKVCLWCDSFLCRTRVSFCSNVCHQLGLVTRCECVCVCVCVCVWARVRVPTYTLKSWQKLNTVFPSSQRSYWSFCQPLSLTHTHTHKLLHIRIFFPLYKRLVFLQDVFLYIYFRWHWLAP